ncbi:MAG: hypothetical protein O3C25_02855 [Chloroflexi bacterium]|nr:hypothetical protein [Chloroflexota bacterium]
MSVVVPVLLALAAALYWALAMTWFLKSRIPRRARMLFLTAAAAFGLIMLAGETSLPGLAVALLLSGGMLVLPAREYWGVSDLEVVRRAWRFITRS